MVTNRLPKPGEFANDRNPAGNTWWMNTLNPLDQVAYWSPMAESAALVMLEKISKPLVAFVHGYNEDWKRDMDVTQAVRDGLEDDFSIVAYSWFSAGSIFEYFQDRARALKSAADLLEALEALDCPSVIAHSMGNFLLQKSLELVKGSARAYINHLAMVAADVPQDALKTSNIAQACRDGLVLWSPADVALAGSSIIHGGLRLGALGPLGDLPHNFKSIDCTGMLPAQLNPVDLHGAYFKSEQCWQLIRGAFIEDRGAAA